MENPIKIDDLGVPLFLETPMCIVLCEITMLEIILLCIWQDVHVQLLVLLETHFISGCKQNSGKVGQCKQQIYDSYSGHRCLQVCVAEFSD